MTTNTTHHDMTVPITECPLCSSCDRDRIVARAKLAARAQNLHMLTDKYIRQLETGGLGYDGLGKWVDRLLNAADDWSSHQSELTNAEWRYRSVVNVHTALAAALPCESEEMSEIPADTECPRIPLAEVTRILDEEQRFFEGHLEWLNNNNVPPSTATSALSVIQLIRQKTTALAETEKGPINA
ncbi:hypothetical protein [Bifidobacterium pseudolongum]|uniref:hypothetical protein n=1 Tax=Bifidobacterium pseudolongum TaxID=1694 RepID=UPI00101F6C70|nr:hypothetical protein [Bifidobacterium pseudolongum]RYQ68750.1 hypothetical protein PG2103B_1029 [Bifidobacterium pseudolongum subsp. globosum]